MFSLMLAPLNTQRIGAGLTLDDIAAVAGVPDEGVVAVAEEGRVVAATADHGVVAVTAEQHVVALAAGDGVVAGAAVDGETDDTRRQGGRIDRVIAAAAVDCQRVLPASGWSMLTWAGSPVTATPVAVATTLIWSLPLVPLTVTLIGRHAVRPVVPQIDRRPASRRSR